MPTHEKEVFNRQDEVVACVSCHVTIDKLNQTDRPGVDSLRHPRLQLSSVLVGSVRAFRRYAWNGNLERFGSLIHERHH